MIDDRDVKEMLLRVRYDLTAAQAKLTDALRFVDELNLPTRTAPRCPHCNIEMRGTHSLAEHVYLAHEGPEPAHWQHAEAIAAAEPMEAQA